MHIALYSCAKTGMKIICSYETHRQKPSKGNNNTKINQRTKQKYKQWKYYY